MASAKQLLAIALAIVIGSAFAGIAKARNETPKVESGLANTEWRLTSFAESETETSVLEGTTITLKFGGDGRASGSAGCNSYAGEYRGQGDSLSFSKIISTRRACLEPRANQQEQRYLAALEGATKFKLEDYRLTILYGDGRGALKFAATPGARPADPAGSSANPASPADLLAAFYEAVNNKDYERAYRYWETPPGDFQEFVRGYAKTVRVRLIAQLPPQVEGAAGSLFAEVPTVVAAQQSDGSERMFAGCYVTRKANLPSTVVSNVQGWRIYKANMSAIPSSTAIPKLLAQACRK